MKTINQTPTLSSEVATNAANQPQLVSQVLVDSINQLKEVYSVVRAYYIESERLKDDLYTDYFEFESSVNTTAYHISNMMGIEMLENTFYAKTSQESEVYHA